MDQDIAALRSFNRFYTRHIGALDARFSEDGATLPEARVLLEVARADGVLASTLQAALDMDAGHISRVLRSLETRGWVARGRDEDARRRPISLTPEGKTAFDTMDMRQRERVEKMLDGLDRIQRRDLVAALGLVRALLDPTRARAHVIRPFRAGDLGLLAGRQSLLYAEMHNWGRPLEVIELETVAAFLRNHRPERDGAWIAEVDGVMAGSVLLTDEGEGLARLRVLYVEPFARGRGIGDALVRTCVNFAREARYDRMTLWTHGVLASARRIYAAHGFRIVATETHTKLGGPEDSETWQLELA